MFTFRIRVFDEKYRFFIKVYATDEPTKEIAHLGWHGGDFIYKDNLYEVRGPYHGLEEYQVFALVATDSKVFKSLKATT
jgi:hypothetical protein